MGYVNEKFKKRLLNLGYQKRKFKKKALKHRLWKEIRKKMSSDYLPSCSRRKRKIIIYYYYLVLFKKIIY
jgi:hypothetical protein